jgi:dCMP deaminase
MKKKLIHAYMQTAKIFAELSHARRLHVGAIVVKDDRIISIGYNGMPAGWDNNCEDKVWDKTGDYELKTKPEVLHAERNALDKLAKGNEGGLGSTMFITHAPCLECAKSIYGAGISQVYYGQAYRDTSGVEFLNKCKVTVEQIDV